MNVSYEKEILLYTTSDYKKYASVLYRLERVEMAASDRDTEI